MTKARLTLLTLAMALGRFAAAPAAALAVPDTTITSGPADGSTIAGPTATFAFESTENPATFKCTLDGTEAVCTSPFTTPPLTAGLHTFEVHAIAGGTQDPTPASRTFMVAAPAAPQQLAVQILSQKAQLKGNHVSVDVGCPASSPAPCTGTFSMSDGKVQVSDFNFIIVVKKSRFGKQLGRPKYGDVAFTLQPGETGTLRAKAKVAKKFGPRVSVANQLKEVTVRTTQPTGPNGTPYTAVSTLRLKFQFSGQNA